MYSFTFKAWDVFGPRKVVHVKAQNVNMAIDLLKAKGFKAKNDDLIQSNDTPHFIHLLLSRLKVYLLQLLKKDLKRLIKMMRNAISRGKTLKCSLEFIGENEDSKALQHLITQFINRLQRLFGSQVETFAAFPYYFEEFLGTIEAGETSSSLGQYLLDYIE